MQSDRAAVRNRSSGGRRPTGRARPRAAIPRRLRATRLSRAPEKASAPWSAWPACCSAATSFCTWIEVTRCRSSHEPATSTFPPLGRRRGSILLPGADRRAVGRRRLEAPRAGVDPLAPRPPHFPAKAKRVIFLFMTGGVSHVDTFDPKPKLYADHGKTVTLDHPETKIGPATSSCSSSGRSGTFKPRRRVRHRGQRPVPAHRRVRRRPLR